MNFVLVVTFLLGLVLGLVLGLGLGFGLFDPQVTDSTSILTVPFLPSLFL